MLPLSMGGGKGAWGKEGTFYKGEIARVHREDTRLVATVRICHILVTGNDLSCIPRLLMVT